MKIGQKNENGGLWFLILANSSMLNIFPSSFTYPLVPFSLFPFSRLLQENLPLLLALLLSFLFFILWTFISPITGSFPEISFSLTHPVCAAHLKWPPDLPAIVGVSPLLQLFSPLTSPWPSTPWITSSLTCSLLIEYGKVKRSCFWVENLCGRHVWVKICYRHNVGGLTKCLKLFYQQRNPCYHSFISIYMYMYTYTCDYIGLCLHLCVFLYLYL